MRMVSLLSTALVAAAPLLAQARPPAPAPAPAPAARPVPATPTAPMPSAPGVPVLPDPTGWGVHILAMDRAPDGSLWVGTYGDGIFVLRPGAAQWENLRSSSDSASRSISWNFVHAFAFHGTDVWYGTIGNGWGMSEDSGRTWRNWTLRELGPRWQYVAPNGIVARGDTVFIGTADGIRWTATRGASWGSITDTVPSPGGLASRYVLTLEPAARGEGLWVSTLRGLGEWHRGAFRLTDPPADPLGGKVRVIHVIEAPRAVAPAVLGSESCIGTLRPKRRQEPARWECMSLFRRSGPASIRQLVGCGGVLCAGATSSGALYSARLGLTLQPGTGSARSRDVYAVLLPPSGQAGDTIFGTACGFYGHQPASCLGPGDTIGVSAPGLPIHTWFGRPIARTDQPYIDQTYRYGSTMGGNFQPHQGVEFNNPAGTTVLAVGAGTVVHAGPAEQGALTVAIRHDSTLLTPEGRFFLYSTYYHNSRLLVRVGQRVARGDPIARVGNTGRATNDHLHLEIHAAPVDSVRLIVDPANRYPAYTRNPELWIEPLPGTGVVAGQVWDSQNRPVGQARVYGIVKPQPQETPFSFAETYGERNHPDPSYREHFAVSDVPPGEYVLGAEIEGRKVFRRVRVEAGKMTWVELRP